MKLVVGLGNPGRKYVKTRHNVGWFVLANLIQKYGISRPREKFYGELVEAVIDGEQILFLAPHTFMNRSGQSVLAARDFYKIPEDDLLVVCDDFNLPLSKLRLRPSGSAGGQNGLADIIRVFGSDQVHRLRIGIGPVPEGWDPSAFVLGKFSKDEKPLVEESVLRAAQGVFLWASAGIDESMNQFN